MVCVYIKVGVKVCKNAKESKIWAKHVHAILICFERMDPLPTLVAQTYIIATFNMFKEI